VNRIVILALPRIEPMNFTSATIRDVREAMLIAALRPLGYNFSPAAREVN
jgi:hypothetical protein